MTYEDLISIDMTRPDPPGNDAPRPTLDGDSGGPVFASTGKNTTRKIWAAGLVNSASICKKKAGSSASVGGCVPSQYMVASKMIHNLKFSQAPGTTMRLRVAP